MVKKVSVKCLEIAFLRQLLSRNLWVVTTPSAVFPKMFCSRIVPGFEK
jgi:hypothetical protein